MDTLLTHQPHRRLNALTGEWVFVSPHRTQRPWQGKVEVVNSSKRPAHDANCYLCAGNLRANGERNPDYLTTYAFTNDFAAFKPEKPEGPASQDGLFSARAHAGTCRVLCFSPRHDLTLADLTPADIRCVIDLWIKESSELGKEWRWVQVFENKGELMGCSNPHPRTDKSGPATTCPMSQPRKTSGNGSGMPGIAGHCCSIMQSRNWPRGNG
jgi:UDPglucose--hexose-1-phosphate uridylyltransferase